MSTAYVIPLACLDCGTELDLAPGERHDDDHTSAAASCPCGARFTVDARLLRDSSPRTRDEVHALRVDAAATAAISTTRTIGA